MIFKRKIPVLLIAMCLIFTLAVAATVSANGMQHQFIPTEYFFGGGYTNSCYNGGEGETLGNFTGYTHVASKAVNGGYVFHINGMKGSAIGETSGDMYQFNGGWHEVRVNGGNTGSLIHVVQVVSNDHDNSYRLWWRIQFAVTPGGELVVDTQILDTICAWEE